MNGTTTRGKLPLLLAVVGGLIAGGGAVALADQRGDGAASPQLEQTIRDYILNHPEIIPEAMTRLRERETKKLLAENRKAIDTPYHAAWAGAAKPDLIVVMFTDYSCSYCRASVADVDRLLAEDRNLRVVWREMPVLGPNSELAAKAALSAAQQGRYLDFHRRMFAEGPPDDRHIERVRKEAGVAPSGNETALDTEIGNNLALARQLGIDGTPTFVIGDKMLQGAVGYEALKQAVAEARRPAA